MFAFIAAVMLVISAGPACASESGPNLPWDSTLKNLQGLLTGNLVKYISITAIFIGGTALIFGEDLGMFGKRILYIVIAAAAIMGAASFFGDMVTGVSGAIV